MVLALIAWTIAVIAGTVSMMSDDLAGAKALAARIGVTGTTPGVQEVTGQFLWVLGVGAVFLWSVPAAAFASCALLLRPATKAKEAKAEAPVAKAPPAEQRADPVFGAQPQAPKPVRNPTIVADQQQKAS